MVDKPAQKIIDQHEIKSTGNLNENTGNKCAGEMVVGIKIKQANARNKISSKYCQMAYGSQKRIRGILKRRKKFIGEKQRRNIEVEQCPENDSRQS